MCRFLSIVLLCCWLAPCQGGDPAMDLFLDMEAPGVVESTLPLVEVPVIEEATIAVEARPFAGESSSAHDADSETISLDADLTGVYGADLEVGRTDSFGHVCGYATSGQMDAPPEGFSADVLESGSERFTPIGATEDSWEPIITSIIIVVLAAVAGLSASMP